MSKVLGSTEKVIGLGGAALTVGSALAYATGLAALATTAPLALAGALLVGAVVVPCMRKPVALTVTPCIGAPAGTIWWRDGGVMPGVSIQLALTQTPEPGRYRGGGTLNRGSNAVEVFRDQAGLQPVAFDRKGNAVLDHADLTSGQLFYLRGARAGNDTLRLTLDPCKEDGVTVTGPVKRQVKVVAVNVITPLIEAPRLVLVDAGDAEYPTTRSQVTVSCKQSNATLPCGDLRISLTYQNKVSCVYASEDEDEVPYVSGSLRHELDLELLMRGLLPGPCQLTASVSSAGNLSDPSWSLGEPVSVTVQVRKLQLRPWRYLNCGKTVAQPGANDQVGAAPKFRELHQHDPAKSFAVAKVEVTAPDKAFWTVATALTLEAPKGLRVYAEQACVKQVKTLKQDDFKAGPAVVWVRTTALTPMVAEGPEKAVNPLPPREPEKAVAAHRLFCGAESDGENFQYADVVRFDTFGFDHFLDNKTANATGRALRDVEVGERNHLNAVSIAGGHNYYDAFSAVHMNRQKEHAPSGGLYKAFVAAINDADDVDDPNGVKTAAGVTYVKEHLQKHAIVLHATMEACLRDYIRSVLDGGGVGDFNKGHGMPGCHAEVLAVNTLLQQGVALQDISVATYRIKPCASVGKRFIACANCSGILRPQGGTGPRILTG